MATDGECSPDNDKAQADLKQIWDRTKIQCHGCENSPPSFGELVYVYPDIADRKVSAKLDFRIRFRGDPTQMKVRFAFEKTKEYCSQPSLKYQTCEWAMFQTCGLIYKIFIEPKDRVLI